MISDNMQAPDTVERQLVPPEVRLFRHIILTAILDAIYGSSLTQDNHVVIKSEAVRWFFEAGEDFQMVCECADLPPDIVRRDALNYIRRERERAPSRSERPRLTKKPRSDRKAA